MTLRAIVDGVDGLPDDVRSHYEEKDGKFYLQVESVGGFALEDVKGLKQALSKEREEARKIKESLKAFDGLDASDIRDQLEELERLRESRKGPSADEIRKAAYEQASKELKKQLDSKDSELKAMTAQLESNIVDAAATSAISSKNGNVRLLLPHVKSQIRMRRTDNGSYIAEVVDPSGNARLSSKTGSMEPMSIDELVAEMAHDDTFGSAFRGSGASGSGAVGSDTASKSPRLAEKDRMKTLSEMDPRKRLEKLLNERREKETAKV